MKIIMLHFFFAIIVKGKTGGEKIPLSGQQREGFVFF
jgi:hypothetical protein